MSVRKRKWTTQSGVEKESWVVDYVDGQGSRRLKTFTRKKDADSFAATTHVEVRKGEHVADNATVAVKEAGELWIASGANAGLERATLDQYRQHLKFHIEPFIGRDKLSKLSVPFVRAFQDRLREEGRSPAMVKRVTASLGAILADAQDRGLVARNAVREMATRKGRGKSRAGERRRKKRLAVGVDIPAREEIKGIVANVKGRWRPVIVTAIFTGLRASELRGLQWGDVDLDGKALHVRRRADRYNVIGMPKSDAGQRVLPLSPIVFNTLREWKLAYPRPIIGKDADGNPVREEQRPEHLVFPNGSGNVESLANIINRGLKPPQVAAGVIAPVLDGEGKPVTGKEGEPMVKAKYTGMHALRHFYASWCINSTADGGLGLEPKRVQERMGHSSIIMTMDVYGHLFPRGDDAEELAEAEAALLA